MLKKISIKKQQLTTRSLPAGGKRYSKQASKQKINKNLKEIAQILKICQTFQNNCIDVPKIYTRDFLIDIGVRY